MSGWMSGCLVFYCMACLLSAAILFDYLASWLSVYLTLWLAGCMTDLDVLDVEFNFCLDFPPNV